jgi:hypothetical protein
MAAIHTPLERGQKNKVEVSRLFLWKQRAGYEISISKCEIPIQQHYA